MQRLIKATKENGNRKFRAVVPAGALQFLELYVLALQQGETYEAFTVSRECVLDIFSGAAAVTVNAPEESRCFKLGRIGIGLHLEFLDFINGRHGSEGVEIRRGVGGAFKRKFVS